MVLLNWVGIYPTITLLLWCLPSSLAERLPLPLMTLIVTALAVPLMSYIVMPILVRAFARWLQAGTASHGTTCTVERSGGPTPTQGVPVQKREDVSRSQQTGAAPRVLT